MKITARIGTCEVSVDDSTEATDPAYRWEDQSRRLGDLIGKTTEAVVSLHRQQVGDDRKTDH